MEKGPIGWDAHMSTRARYGPIGRNDRGHSQTLKIIICCEQQPRFFFFVSVCYRLSRKSPYHAMDSALDGRPIQDALTAPVTFSHT